MLSAFFSFVFNLFQQVFNIRSSLSAFFAFVLPQHSVIVLIVVKHVLFVLVSLFLKLNKLNKLKVKNTAREWKQNCNFQTGFEISSNYKTDFFVVLSLCGFFSLFRILCGRVKREGERKFEKKCFECLKVVTIERERRKKGEGSQMTFVQWLETRH